jgi:hypothetical protein
VEVDLKRILSLAAGLLFIFLTVAEWYSYHLDTVSKSELRGKRLYFDDFSVERLSTDWTERTPRPGPNCLAFFGNGSEKLNDNAHIGVFKYPVEPDEAERFATTMLRAEGVKRDVYVEPRQAQIGMFSGYAWISVAHLPDGLDVFEKNLLVPIWHNGVMFTYRKKLTIEDLLALESSGVEALIQRFRLELVSYDAFATTVAVSLER